MTTPRMRAGNTDRQGTVDRLTHHFTEGRLTPDEFDERVGQAYAATHLDELPDLLADLPEQPVRRGPGPGGWQRPDGRPAVASGQWSPQRRQMHRPPPIVAVLAVVGALAMLIAVTAVTHGFFPLLWIALIPLFIARGHRRRQWAAGPQELHRPRGR